MATVPTFTDDLVVHAADLNFLLNPPQVSAYQSTPQSAIATATPTIVTLDSNFYDADGMHPLSGAHTDVTIQTPGKWSIKIQALWATGTGNLRQIDLRKNAGGSATGGVRLDIDVQPPTSGGATKNRLSIDVGGLVVGDVLQLFAEHDNPSSLSFFAGTFAGCVGIQARFIGT